MKLRMAALTLMILALAPLPLRAQATASWTGLSLVDGNITDPLNWLVLPPASGDNVLFNTPLGQTNVLVPTYTLNDITIGSLSPVYTFIGTGVTPVLTLNGNLTSASTNYVSFLNSLTLSLSNTTHTVDTGVNDIDIFSIVSGTGSIVKAGTGSLQLDATNTYTGTTTITNGTLTASSLANGGASSSIGASSNAASNLVLNGGTLLYTGGNGSTDRLFTLGVNGGTINISNPTVVGNFSFTNTGDVAFSGSNTAQTLTVAGNPSYSSTVYFSPRITDNGTGLTSVVAANGSFWRFSAANTYTGGTTVENGGFLIAVNSTGSATGTGLLTIDSGGRFGIGSNSPDGAISSNVVVNGSLEFNRSTDYTYGGTLSGTGTLLHTGASGALTLNAASPSFSGTTNLGTGKLVVAANSALGTSTVNINGGKLLLGGGVSFGNTINFGGSGGTLGGNGTFTSPLTLGTGGVTLSPGIGGPGSLDFATGLTANNGLGASIEIRAPSGTPGTDWDVIDVTGTFDLAPLTGTGNFSLKVISLTPGNTPGAVSGLSGTTSWDIAIATTLVGFDPLDFTIDSSQFTGGGIFTLSQTGENLTLTFTPVPEPSNYALLALGLMGTGLAAWRRKCSRGR